MTLRKIWPLRFLPKILQRDTQAIGQAVNIGIICDDLINVQNSPITKPLMAQGGHIIPNHIPRSPRQFGRVVEHCSLTRGQGCLSVILLKLFDQRFIFNQPEETRSMMDQSVMAPIERRHDHRNHLPLRAADGRLTIHYGFV